MQEKSGKKLFYYTTRIVFDVPILQISDGWEPPQFRVPAGAQEQVKNSKIYTINHRKWSIFKKYKKWGRKILPYYNL